MEGQGEQGMSTGDSSVVGPPAPIEETNRKNGKNAETSSLEVPSSPQRKKATIAPVVGEDRSPLLVLKIGTSSLMVSDTTGQRLKLANVAQLVEVISVLKRDNYRVVLVTSGAVGMGCIKLGLTQKPSSLRTKQAVAAAGQSQLMRMYEDLFATVRVQVAQMLISQNDFLCKEHWSNVKGTIMECLNLGVVPIINENDSTNTQELRFGDNDNLAAMTAVQLGADGLFLFTDVDYLYTANPNDDPSAKALWLVREPWALQVATSGGSNLGTGGMVTKIMAARTASSAGIPCCLINGKYPMRLLKFLNYDFHAVIVEPVVKEGGGVTKEDAVGDAPEGTYFQPLQVKQKVGDTRRWIFSLPVSGEVIVDAGAVWALANRKSLLPAGIMTVKGRFLRDEAVKFLHNGAEIARGIVNFDGEELMKIRGCRSSEFEKVLGYSCSAEACHRDNIILTASADALKNLNEMTKEKRRSWNVRQADTNCTSDHTPDHTPDPSPRGSSGVSGKSRGMMRRNSSFT